MQSAVSAPAPGMDSRPSLADTRRISSGVVGGGGSGYGSYRDKEDAVPVAFDEGILRGLCDMDVSLGHLLCLLAMWITLWVGAEQTGLITPLGGQNQAKYSILQGTPTIQRSQLPPMI